MIRVGDFKNGTVFADGDDIFTVVWFQHHKPGKGGAVVRLKIKNMKRGSTVEKSMKPEVKFREVDVARRNKTFLYKDATGFHFMDKETYEQEHLTADVIGESAQYMKDDMEVIGLHIDGTLTSIEMPINVDYEIKETEPGIKGNTAQGVKKPAKIETGADVQVPLFINAGDKVTVNTVTGEYVGRVS